MAWPPRRQPRLVQRRSKSFLHESGSRYLGRRVMIMRARRLGVVLLLWGCGNTEKPASPSTSGGQGSGTGGNTGGSNANASGSSTGGTLGASGSSTGGMAGSSNSIGVTLGNTPGEACIAYAWAVCSRRGECFEGGFYNCTVATLACPDVTFSPGSTRSVEVLKECAATYQTLPCDQVRVEKLPSCVTPGTRPPGEQCLFVSQCSGLSCNDSETCGRCGVRAVKGESCADPNVQCEVGTTCNTETDLCEAPTIKPGETPGANQACTELTGCVSGYLCKLDGLGGGTCSPEPKVNEACPDNVCSTGNYCAADATCKPLPTTGQPCGLGSLGDFHCTGSTCEVAGGLVDGTCKAYPKLGEPCITVAGNPDSGFCTDGLHCDRLTTPHVCKGPGKTGEGCGSHNDCLGLSQCGCADPAVSDCTDKRCIELHVAGQPCTAPNTRCHPAFECVSGVCQAITLRGDFAAACGI